MKYYFQDLIWVSDRLVGFNALGQFRKRQTTGQVCNCSLWFSKLNLFKSSVADPTHRRAIWVKNLCVLFANTSFEIRKQFPVIFFILVFTVWKGNDISAHWQKLVIIPDKRATWFDSTGMHAGICTYVNSWKHGCCLNNPKKGNRQCQHKDFDYERQKKRFQSKVTDEIDTRSNSSISL